MDTPHPLPNCKQERHDKRMLQFSVQEASCCSCLRHQRSNSLHGFTHQTTHSPVHCWTSLKPLRVTAYTGLSPSPPGFRLVTAHDGGCAGITSRRARPFLRGEALNWGSQPFYGPGSACGSSLTSDQGLLLKIRLLYIRKHKLCQIKST